jgi:hypothetical protein
MNNVVNVGLLTQPVNWLVIWSMLLVWWLLFEALTRSSTAETE